MNIYLKGSPFTPVLGLFAAKCGAKRKVKRYKTRGEMVQNAVQNAAKRKTKSIKIHSNGINKTFYHHQNHG